MSRHPVSGWIRATRLSRLFSVPGDVLAGFLLASGGSLYVWSKELIPLMLAAVMAYLAGSLTNELADMKFDCMKQTWKPLPAGDVSPRAVLAGAVLSALLALVFAISTGAWIPPVLVLLILMAAASFDFKSDPAGGRKALSRSYLAACRFLTVALGAAGAYLMLKEKVGAGSIAWEFFLTALVYAVGETLYVYGVSTAADEKVKILSQRPGRWFFLIGACISYAVLFLFVVGKPTNEWHSLTCGIVSAVSAAVFLLITYGCFRFFYFPLPPSRIRAAVELQVCALILLQAAAVSAMGVLIPAGILLLCAVFSKVIDSKCNLRGPL